MVLPAQPLDRDTALHMTEWGVPVQPIVVFNGRVIYGLQPKQEVCFHHTPLSDEWADNGSPLYIGYGGAAGGAKSHTARAILTRAALQWAGSVGIIFRKTLRELEENHIEKFLEEIPKELGRYNSQKKLIRWVNGSRTYFGYLESDKDKFRYQGSEYDVMVFEESTHYPFETVNWLLSNRLRATVAGAIPFAVFPSNPGNVGHFWFKRWFIDGRFKEDEGEIPGEYAFIQAYLEDNQILLTRDPKYLPKLNKLPEPWRSWMRDGDFEAGAGLFFPTLSRKIHLVKPYEVPPHWPLFSAFDWGFNHPWVFGIYAGNEDGGVVKLDTWTGRGETNRQIVESFMDMANTKKIDLNRLQYTVCGLDAFHHKGRELGYEGPTMGEILVEGGLTPIEANTGRVYGATNLRNYLHWEKDPWMPPGLTFMDTPGNRRCFECLEARVSDEKNIEDVLKTDADAYGEGGDDDYDETRYAMASRPEWAPSIGLDRQLSAFDPEVLAYEAEVKYRVKDLPLKRGQSDRDAASRGLL